MDSANLVARKAGLTAKTLNALFDQFCSNPKDSVWVDLSDGSPAKIRVNGYNVIKIKK